jgi:hypothetical protein
MVGARAKSITSEIHSTSATINNRIFISIRYGATRKKYTATSGIAHVTKIYAIIITIKCTIERRKRIILFGSIKCCCLTVCPK